MRLDILLSFSCLLLATNAENEEISKDLSKSLLNGNQTVQEYLQSHDLKFLPSVFQSWPKVSISNAELDLTCTACQGGVGAMIDLFLLGASVEQVEELARGLCTLIGVIDMGVCNGAIDNYAPQLQHIVTHSHPHVKAAEVCAMLLGKGCGAWEYVNEWTVDIPHGDKPEPEVI